ncbi:MAG: hypothetical protein MZW92_39520 [Comamonadaceae bacterium]|nr:hypothetical protein [Comamonadaceae bacterium]
MQRRDDSLRPRRPQSRMAQAAGGDPRRHAGAGAGPAGGSGLPRVPRTRRCPQAIDTVAAEGCLRAGDRPRLHGPERSHQARPAGAAGRRLGAPSAARNPARDPDGRGAGHVGARDRGLRLRPALVEAGAAD